ncbi:MAG TPA: aldolase/citrate lyase family protein [Tepidiformaceae bacterium]|nr:aldolase/citrate lyase family protein [Tepidiformaceae bacterium]
MRLRSIIAIPASLGGIDEALESAADALLFTLADSSRDVSELRNGVAEALGRVAERGKAGLAVVNHPRTKLLRDDLDAILSPALRGVLVPHAVEPQDVRDAAVLLREFELKRNIEPGSVTLYPVIDTARGMLKAEGIAAAAPRVGGLVFHTRRYAHDIGGRDEQRGERLAYGRGKVVAVSRAYGHAPMVYTDGLELTYLAETGFASAILPEPRYVVNANALFAPSPASKEFATRALAAYEQAKGESSHVARLGETVIDGPAAHKARHILEE